MPIKCSAKELAAQLSAFTLEKNGDWNERHYFSNVIEYFPRYQELWRLFIVPMTNRIDPNVIFEIDKIHARVVASDKLQDIAEAHYSIFLNLMYASECLRGQHLSYFENFYAHLGSACDLVEEFITLVHYLILECTNQETEILQRLSKTKFVEIAKDWYDKHYNEVYKHYLSKGKYHCAKLISRSSVFKEYFKSSKEWKEYDSVSMSIKTYRNVIVHNPMIASFQISTHDKLVPKKEKILQYKKWRAVFLAKDIQIKNDFILHNELMKNDYILFLKTLNNLWSKPVQELSSLLFEEKNILLLKMFDLELE